MKKKWHLPFLLVLILGTWLAYQQKHPQERYIREEQIPALIASTVTSIS